MLDDVSGTIIIVMIVFTALSWISYLYSKFTEKTKNCRNIITERIDYLNKTSKRSK